MRLRKSHDSTLTHEKWLKDSISFGDCCVSVLEFISIHEADPEFVCKMESQRESILVWFVPTPTFAREAGGDSAEASPVREGSCAQGRRSSSESADVEQIVTFGLELPETWECRQLCGCSSAHPRVLVAR